MTTSMGIWNGLKKFSKFVSWTPNFVDNERLVWLKCYAYPVHAWLEDFFQAPWLLLWRIEDEPTKYRAHLNVARFYSQTSVQDFINYRVKVKIGEDFSTLNY